jgi:hypothetical protein
VDRLNGGGRGEMLDKIIQKKKHELSAAKGESIDDLKVEEVF